MKRIRGRVVCFMAILLSALWLCVVGGITAQSASAIPNPPFVGCFPTGITLNAGSAIGNLYTDHPTGASGLMTYRADNDAWCPSDVHPNQSPPYTGNITQSWVRVEALDHLGWVESGEQGNAVCRCVYHFAQASYGQSPSSGVCSNGSGKFCYTVMGAAVCAANSCDGDSNLAAHSHYQFEWVDQPTGLIYSQIDATMFINAGWSPFGHWAYPFVTRYGGDALFEGSNIIGRLGFGKVYDTNLYTQKQSSGAWDPACNNTYYQTSTINAQYRGLDFNFHAAIVNCQEIDSWTDPEYSQAH